MITKQTIKDFRTFGEFNSIFECAIPPQLEPTIDSHGKPCFNLWQDGKNVSIPLKTIVKKAVELLEKLDSHNAEEVTAFKSLINRIAPTTENKTIILCNLLSNNPFLSVPPSCLAIPSRTMPVITSTEPSSSARELIERVQRARNLTSEQQVVFVQRVPKDYYSGLTPPSSLNEIHTLYQAEQRSLEDAYSTYTPSSSIDDPNQTEQQSVEAGYRAFTYSEDTLPNIDE